MNKPLAIFSLLLLSLFSSYTHANSARIPIESFSKDTEYSQVTISPSGEYLAVVNKVKGKNVLVILDAQTFKTLHAVSFRGDAQVGDYHWVNNERVAIAKEYLRGWKDHPEYYGEIYGVNVDGKKSKYLIGYLGEQQIGSRIKKQTPLYGTSFILDPLIKNKRKMLVMTIPWTSSNEPHTVVYWGKGKEAMLIIEGNKLQCNIV